MRTEHAEHTELTSSRLGQQGGVMASAEPTSCQQQEDGPGGLQPGVTHEGL